MNTAMRAGAGAVVLLVTGAILLSQEVSAPPSSSPAETAPSADHPKRLKLTQPWSKLKTLSEAQKEQISQIHHRALEERAAIQANEIADILAILTDAQKAELQKLSGEEAIARKMKAAQRKATAGDATQPSDAQVPPTTEPAEAGK